MTPETVLVGRATSGAVKTPGDAQVPSVTRKAAIAPDDARHGKVAGYEAGCHDDCCRPAHARYVKSLRLHQERYGTGISIPTYRALRRLQALATIGWSRKVIAARLGIKHQSLYKLNEDTSYVTQARFAQIDQVYRELSMRVPPQATKADRVRVAMTKAAAARNGWAPPLAWDDIDDPNEVPNTHAHAGASASDLPEEPPDVVDEVLVDRVLSGDFGHPARAARLMERLEVAQRWSDQGGSINDLDRLAGWNIHRDRRTAETRAAKTGPSSGRPALIPPVATTPRPEQMAMGYGPRATPLQALGR